MLEDVGSGKSAKRAKHQELLLAIRGKRVEAKAGTIAITVAVPRADPDGLWVRDPVACRGQAGVATGPVDRGRSAKAR